MILRRFFTLVALAVAALLSLSDRANAGYDYSTSVPIGNVTGASVGPATSSAAFTLTGGTTITPSNSQVPYTFFTDGGGSTIYLVNSSATNVGYGVNTGAPVENVYVSTPVGVTDKSTWSFTEIITVTNQSVSLGPPNATGTFTETAQYVMNVTGGTGNAQISSVALTGPTSITIGANSFSINTPTQTQVQVNNATPGAVGANITSIPEPASVVMLGVGLVGVAGLGLRRMKKQD